MIIIKTKKEIDYIRESAKIVAETLQLCKAHAKEGVTTWELDKIAEDYILSTKDLLNNKYILIQKGKKNYFLVRVV